MEERLRIGQRAVAVGMREAEAGRLRLEIDGAVEDLRVVASSGGVHLVEIGGALEILYTARSAEGTWVWHRGRARLVERAPQDRPARPAGATPGAAPVPRGPALPLGAVTPPMPAVVLAVLVEEGQAVERGQPLVVVSAMKTESELTAPFAGTVRSVGARVGAKVRPGDVLVQVEADGGRHAG